MLKSHFSIWNLKSKAAVDVPNKPLVDELHKPFIRKFQKSKVYSIFVDNVWDFKVVINLISKYSKGRTW